MRSYKQVSDILRRVTVWHEELLGYLDQEAPENAPLRPAVTRLAGHRATIEHALESFDPETREKVLNTWLQYLPAEQVEEVLVSHELGDTPSAAEVTEMVSTFEEGLRTLYRTLADSGNSPPHVQKLFRQLLHP